MKVSETEFHALILDQLDTLYRFARRLTRDAARAEDLVQETYVRALRAREDFQLREYGVRPWLLRIMHNLFTSRGEREARGPQTAEPDLLESAGGTADADLPIDPGSFEAMDERLVAALDDLPGEYRAAMLLWAVEELSYKEIATALDVPIGTVMSRLHRARAKLAQNLRGFAAEQGLDGHRSMGPNTSHGTA